MSSIKITIKMTKKDKILHLLKNTYCRVKGSKIEGVGIFAVRDIPKGIDPFLGMRQEYWHKFSLAELKDLPTSVLKMIDDFFVREKNNTVYIPEYGLNGIDISFFVNHSKKPNLKTKDGFKFVTARKIKAGEELTIDYNTYEKY